VPLELTLSLNGHAHTITAMTNGAGAYSDKCGLVSFFHAGLNIVFEVGRDGNHGVVARTETNESAPTKSGPLYTFELPTGVPMTQEIATISPTGKRSKRTCSATSVAVWQPRR
jgi:hypothetical protein